MAMQTFEDDELDSVKPTPTAKSGAAAAPAPAQTPKPQPKPQAQADDFDEDTPKAAKPEADDSDVQDTDFDDEKVYARPGQLDRVRPDKGRAVRIALIKAVRMKTAKSHFVEIGTGKDLKQGTYRCLSPVGSDEQAFCCQKLQKDGTIHVAALVLVYTNADPTTGKYAKGADGTVPPIEWKLGFVDLSGFNMKQLKKLPDEDATPYDIDIIMTHAEGRAFGYEFNRASNKARWQHNPELVKEVEAAIERFKDGKTLVAKLGKRLNLIEWKALLSGVGAGEEAKLDNMDEL